MRLLSRHNRVLWVNSIGCRTPSVASKADMSRVLKKLASFMEPIREPEPNIFVLSPFAIPFYGRVRQIRERPSAALADPTSDAETFASVARSTGWPTQRRGSSPGNWANRS